MDNEKAMKEAAWLAQKQAASQGLGGMIGGIIGGMITNQEPCRPSLYERIQNSAFRASTEASKAERLKELQHLADKNPEIIRLLDLLEDVRG